MEKTININSTINSSNKNQTKKKDDLQKKADIKAIMEKYNLKVPRKSKLQDNKTEYIIKPKDDKQIIHITKEKAVQQTVEEPKAVFAKTAPKAVQQTVEEPKAVFAKTAPKAVPQNVEEPKAVFAKTAPKAVQQTVEEPKVLNVIKHPINTKEIDNIKSLSETRKSDVIKPLLIQNQNTQANNYNNNYNNKEVRIAESNIQKPSIKPPLQIIEKPITKEEIIQKPLLQKPLLQNPSLQTIINNDKHIAEKQKLEMPKAIINKNNIHPKDFMNSSNIYNLIPTINPSKQYSHLNNRLNNQSINKTSLDTKININNIQKNQNTYKNISINPNLSEDASQFYKGEKALPIRKINEEFQNNQYEEKKPPSQIKTIANNPKNIIIQKKKDIVNLGINNANSNANSIQIEENLNSLELNNLEMKRKFLQEQQQTELAKLKYKKEQIHKINNRKKEIELMKSIDYEKQKLRMIQNKQIELNNIINTQIQPLQQPLQHTQKHIIYNVDAKKTKKNINSSFLEKSRAKNEEEDSSFLEKSRAKNEEESSFLEKSRAKNEEEDSSFLEKSRAKNEEEEDKEEDKKEDKKEEEKATAIKLDKVDKIIIKSKDKQKIELNSAPYKYHNKKDVPTLKWASKAELYDVSTFTENLTISLGIQPIFFNKKLIKDKSSLEERIQILQNVYHFKNISKFNNNAIHSIYKILEYDKIILLN
jgi:hypothetical protein